MCSDTSVLLLITDMQTQKWPAIVVTPPLMFQAPPSVAEMTSTEFKGLAPFVPPCIYFSYFTLLGAKYWRRGHQKQLHIRGKLNTNHACPEEGAGSEKTWEDLVITPHTDPRYRNSLQQSKKWKQQQNPANPGEGKDFDFQSCYIIWFNYLMSSSQPKHRKVYKQTGKHGLFKGKINQQKLSLTKTWWWIY